MGTLVLELGARQGVGALRTWAGTPKSIGFGGSQNP